MAEPKRGRVPASSGVRQLVLDMAAAGARVPVGTDLVLREQADAEAIPFDGRRLGQVVIEAAQRYRTPLAIPLMDLTVEKAALLKMLDVPEAQIAAWHFAPTPDGAVMDRILSRLSDPLDPRTRANADAVAYVARQTGRTPVAMAIGPFSLMTKLLADPITPVYMAGTGLTGRDEPEVAMVETALELSVRIIERSLSAQIRAGAKAVMICEPAANKVYLSPLQIEQGADIFERYVMQPNRRLKALLDDQGVDLIFHCCGELTDMMVRSFASLEPAMLSLGSSRKLWEDAALVPKDVVLYGNLPSKRFYDDALISVEDVRRQSRELVQHMRRAGHPFILGSECDVLSVPGCEHAIKAKVAAMMEG